MRRQLFGATLLDVVVALAIIGIAVVVLLPAFARVRAEDKRTACASNLNQLAKAMYMYADVPANGLFPTRATGKDPYADDKPLLALNLLYKGYVLDIRYFYCPAAPPRPDSKPEPLTAAQAKTFADSLALLGADEFEKRDKAYKAIQALGPGALPNVEAALKNTTDPEVRARLYSLVAEFTDGELAKMLAKITPAKPWLPKEGTFLSPATSSYGYDPGHSPNDAVAALMADRKGTEKNSDNHGPNAGQNVLLGAGCIEFRNTVENIGVNANGKKLVDPDIYSLNAKGNDEKNAGLTRDMDGFIRQ
ncbi:MAG: type II secretion system protein [Planctomycetota bacterium]|nr:type II secretion system protein [Planctomycetota bacterium]